MDLIKYLLSLTKRFVYTDQHLGCNLDTCIFQFDGILVSVI
jgi:hypothetical protein